MSTQEKRTRISELVELAGIYLDDGAPETAAARLHAAAALADQLAAERRHRIFGLGGGK